MSGIYIKGMEMPHDENDSIHILQNGTVVVYRTGSIDFYKAIPVPDHGGLVDGDKIVEGCKDKEGRYISQFAAAIGETVEAAPTIIPADHFADVGRMVTDKEWPEWRSQVWGQPYTADKEGN